MLIQATRAEPIERRPVIASDILRQMPTNGRCCFVDSCNQKAVCPDAGTLYLDSCGDKYKLSKDCKRTLRKKKDENTCCFFDTCYRRTICRPKGGMYRCNGLFDVSDSCKLVPRTKPSPKSRPSKTPSASPSSMPSATPSATPTPRAQECCYVDACSGAILCKLSGLILSDSCGNDYNIDEKCGLSKADENAPSTGDCCYRDPCNKRRLCGNKQGRITDSCGSDYSIDSNCKLDRIGSDQDCCFIDRCNLSKICGRRGGILITSCNVDYRISHECSLHSFWRDRAGVLSGFSHACRCFRWWVGMAQVGMAQVDCSSVAVQARAALAAQFVIDNSNLDVYKHVPV